MCSALNIQFRKIKSLPCLNFYKIIRKIEQCRVTILSEFPFILFQDCNNDTYIELQQEEFIKLLEVRHELLRSKTDQVFPIGYTSRTDTQHLTESGVDFTKVTYNNVPLLLEKVPNQSISTIQVYYCCKQCGKVYWEGPHWKSTIDKLSGVLK